MKYSLSPLVPGSGRRNKNEFIVCDIETQNWTKFLVIGVYDGSSVHNFRSLSKFLDHVFDHHDGLDCFAHFGGRFDFLFIIQEILKTELYEIENMVPRGSGLLYFDGIRRADGAKITFRDSSALLPFSLKRLTHSFKVDSLKQEWDHSKTNGVTPELLKYLEYDLKGLYEVIEKFYSWSIINNSGRAYTIASQALKVFRTYLKEEIPCLSPKLNENLRKFYFGGRVEIFNPMHRGPSPLYSYDVNSLYPTVMKENPFPGGFRHIAYQYEKRSLGFYEAIATTPKNLHIPVLGISHEGKYIFPLGTFKGYWTSAEIEYAISLGYKFKIEKGYIFKNAGYIFKDFVDDLYAIRAKAEKDSVDSTIAKLLLNSCYGKFGQNPEKENLVFDDGSEGLKPLREIKVGKNIYRLATKQVTLESFTHVGIAAFVTSYGRIKLHRLMMENPDAMFYTDTDSLFTTHKYPTGSKLGDLKLESTVKSACFLLPKTYIAGEKIAMKGFDQKKIKHFTMDDFTACLEGDLKALRIIQEPKFATFKTAIRSGEIVSMTKESPRQIRSRYDKRQIIKLDKFRYRTCPITINQKGV